MPDLYPGAIWRPAPGPYQEPSGPGHWEDRPAGHSIEFIVAHHSAVPLDVTIAGFTNPNLVNSAHLAIDRNDPINDVYQFVGLDKVAFHAGDLAANWVGIGVETIRIWGDGPGTAGYQPITPGQYLKWHEVALWLARYAGWTLDASRLYPHHAFTQTTCPGDLELARIVQGDPDMTPEEHLWAAEGRNVLTNGLIGDGTGAKSHNTIQLEELAVAVADLATKVAALTPGGGGAEPKTINLTLTGTGTGTLT